MIKLIELVIPRILPEFSYDVRPKTEMGADAARTFPDLDQMHIREDVYEQAWLLNPTTTRLYGQHNFTLAHEMGHLFLHKGSASFARSHGEQEHKIYMDSEWQADEFAAAFTMPREEVLYCRCAEDIEERFLVSASAAQNRYKNVVIKGQ